MKNKFQIMAFFFAIATLILIYYFGTGESNGIIFATVEETDRNSGIMNTMNGFISLIPYAFILITLGFLFKSFFIKEDEK